MSRNAVAFTSLFIYSFYWRVEASPPLSVEFVEFSLYLYIYIPIYIYIYMCVYIFQAVRHAHAVNAQRTNVEPAG